MIIHEIQDLRYLQWREAVASSGTGGSFLKSAEGSGTGQVYYKMSCYDSYRGVFGHECVNELIASRLLSLLGIPHVPYTLVHARVLVDGQEIETWISRSPSYRRSTDQKQAFDTFYRLRRLEGESPLETADRMGWGLQVRQMMLADFLICNRDRHGANVEVIQDESENLHLAPLFDNGLSFIFSCYDSAERAASFDVMEDRMVNNFIGSRSLEENLAFLKNWDMRITPLPTSWESAVFEGLAGILPQTHLATIKKMIDSRWAYAVKALEAK